MNEVLDRLRDALAGTYAVERELGAGGMATVYLAHDVKHGRPVAIKVLRPGLTQALGAERFFKEIDIAARFTHPNILPLHDSGEVDGVLYYVMPYVEGESLRDRIKREKQLPLEDALQITREVAKALAYAHAHDVIHRDIKPENILLSSGQAVVADFGIARAINVAENTSITGTGITTGTPAYMSPEQASGTGDLDGRSDVYSLGCVLYEMLTGEPPYTGPSAQAIMARQMAEPVPRISTVRNTVPDQLEQTVFRCLAKVPADRFATAAQLDDALGRLMRGDLSLSDPTLVIRATRRTTVRRFAAIGAALALVTLFFFVRASQGIGFTERDWVLITDLENNTGDVVFDRSLLNALTVAIDQSQHVNVFPRNRVYETLSRMARDSVDRIDVELASEIAQRENIKAVLAFSLSNIDSTYVLTTRLVDPFTGVTVKSRDVQVDGKGRVLDALDGLARRTRRDLGESLGEIEQRGIPLPLATTPSLEALKFHADGNVAWSSSRYREAQVLWEQAVALDSNFAWAHASLGLAIGWLDSRNAAQPHYEKALSLLDRVTEKERLWITALATDGEESLTALRIYLQQYPDDRDAWYNLGNGLREVRRLEDALAAYDSALAIDSMYVWANVNSAMVHDALGRFEEAGRAWARAIELQPEVETQTPGDLNRASGFVLAKLGDTAQARVRFEKVLSGPNIPRANGYRSLGLLAMYRGEYRNAIDHLREASLLGRTENALLTEYRNRLYLATAYRAKGMMDDVERQLDAADQLVSRMRRAGTGWLVHLGYQYAVIGSVPEARRILDTLVARGETHPANRASTEYMRGLVALAEGNAADAIEPLELSQRLWATHRRLEALGSAHFAVGNLDRAEQSFLELIEMKPLGTEAQEPWLGAHYQLGRVYEAQGDIDKALAYYQRLADLWAHGDDDIEVLSDVRSRITALTREQTP